MQFLALDLATSTGWCHGDGSSDPSLGTLTLTNTGDDLGPFFDQFFRWLHAKISDLIAEGQLETTEGSFGSRLVRTGDILVTLEAPILPAARFDPKTGRMKATTNPATTRKLQGLAGVVEMVCHQRNVACEETYIASVKKALAGTGNAAKVDMMAAAQGCGLKPPTHDAADAFGIWLLQIRTYAPEYRGIWDKRLYRSFGAMF